nr:immunoglobulin heavy chain junction region [Macaca mulatta]
CARERGELLRYFDYW